MKTLIVITGPTAVGKTALCMNLARHFNIPIINADSRQIFRELKIGTAAPTEEQLRQVRHYFVGTLDPEHWAIVDRKNPRRVVHALEICHMTGKTYTSFRKREERKRPFQIVKMALTLPREELYSRINARVDVMMQQGLLDEARRLLPWRHLNALNTVGYKEMFAYMDHVWTLDEAVERMKGNTRRYARKQLTGFKKDNEVTWFSPCEVEQIIEHILKVRQ